MRKPLSLYIHIPFCKSKCNYCAFTSFCLNESEMFKFLNSLKTEIEFRSEQYSGKYEITSIYIGGGTPSVLPNGAIGDILDTIYKNFVVRNDAEITIEANPSSLTQEKAKEYESAGINRVSMGLQAKQDKHLKVLGRLHTAENFKASVELLHSVGITNINGDLILGLPNQTPEEVKESVEFLTSLGVTHSSIYMLELEENTPITKLVNGGLLSIPTESETIKLYSTAKTELEKNGFSRYEISNFSKSGFESHHNKVYWNRGEYLGFGVSGASFVDGTRFQNTASLSVYNDRIKNNEIPLEYREVLTPEEKAEETILLSLRTTNGLNLTEFQNEFGGELITKKKDVIKSLITDGFLILNPHTDTLCATDKGFMVLDKIISMLVD